MKELLIKNLNEQLVSEYKAIVNYLYQSANVQDDEIRKAMEEFSRHELEHARILIRYILELGGEPVSTIPPMDIEQDEIQVLIYSIAGEESAVKKYTMIKQLIDDPEHIEIIDSTIKVEEAHYRLLNEIFNKVKKLFKKTKDEN